MQLKTVGIVLHSIKHTDSATIITVYTQQLGRVAYLIYGANKKKSTVRTALLQPLSILELDVSHSPGKELQRVKEARSVCHLNRIASNPVKNALALFISEILFRTLKQSQPDEYLFLFLENSIQQLDHLDGGLANFHLVFLLKLSRYLGFAPNAENMNARYFDLMNGVFLSDKPSHMHYLLPDITEGLRNLLQADYLTMQRVSFSRQDRNRILDSIVEFYRLHIPDFHSLHSLQVLHSLFD